jgi:hypothetical protein
MLNPVTPFERAMTLAALSGLKLTLGPAFLAATRRRPESRHLVLAAMGEMLLDKAGIFPGRFRLPLLIPRTLAGAWVARESLREDGIDDAGAALAGAVVAAGTACVAPMLRIAARRGLGIPDAVLGAAEDYMALRLGAQATGVSMNQIAEIAKEALEDGKEHVMSALPAVGVNVGVGA